jgi:FG-GAP repeat protein
MKAHLGSHPIECPGQEMAATHPSEVVRRSSGVGFLLMAPAQAQFFQQGPKLVGTDAAGGGFQGNSVSLSGDGNTAIVGAPFDNGNTGAAWVYTRSGGVWNEQAKLVGAPAS